MSTDKVKALFLAAVIGLVSCTGARPQNPPHAKAIEFWAYVATGSGDHIGAPGTGVYLVGKCGWRPLGITDADGEIKLSIQTLQSCHKAVLLFCEQGSNDCGALRLDNFDFGFREYQVPLPQAVLINRFKAQSAPPA